MRLSHVAARGAGLLKSVASIEQHNPTRSGRRDSSPGERASAKRTRESMQHRRLTLADGRYLIFYTFDEDAPAEVKPSDTPAQTNEPKREVDARPIAEEERRV